MGLLLCVSDEPCGAHVAVLVLDVFGDRQLFMAVDRGVQVALAEANPPLAGIDQDPLLPHPCDPIDRGERFAHDFTGQGLVQNSEITHLDTSAVIFISVTFWFAAPLISVGLFAAPLISVGLFAGTRNGLGSTEGTLGRNLARGPSSGTTRLVHIALLPVAQNHEPEDHEGRRNKDYAT